MRNFILLLIIAASVSAFSVDTVTNFPSQMYGGGVYSAFYNINGDAIYPVYAFVDAPEDFAVDCPYHNGWVCNTTNPNFNITVRMPSNIKPDDYNITVQFSANYTTPDAPTYNGGGGSNGGGSSGGYSIKNKTKEKELTEAEAAIKSGEDLLNKTVPAVSNASIKPPEYTNWIPDKLPDAYIKSLTNSSFNTPLLASMTGVTDNSWLFVMGLILLIILLLIIFFLTRKKPKPTEEIQ